MISSKRAALIAMETDKEKRDALVDSLSEEDAKHKPGVHREVFPTNTAGPYIESAGEPQTRPPAFSRSKTAPLSAPGLATSSPARNAEHDSDGNPHGASRPTPGTISGGLPWSGANR